MRISPLNNIKFGQSQFNIISMADNHGEILSMAQVIKAMQENIVPPTINLDNPDEELPKGIDLVPNVAKKRKVDVAISNSFGFGGTNASLVIKRVK